MLLPGNSALPSLLLRPSLPPQRQPAQRETAASAHTKKDERRRDNKNIDVASASASLRLAAVAVAYARAIRVAPRTH